MQDDIVSGQFEQIAYTYHTPCACFDCSARRVGGVEKTIRWFLSEK